jgi:hypothetical protein
MRSGITGEKQGYDLIINGVDPSFRNREEVALEAARYWKQPILRIWSRCVSARRASVF